MKRRSQESFDHYRDRADPIVAALAAALVVLLSVSLSTATGDLPPLAVVAAVLIWFGLAIDVLIRLLLTPDVRAYMRRHPLELLSVLIPFLRIVLVGRLFAILGRDRGRLADRATGYVVYLTVLVVVFGALLATSVESGAPGATITSFGEGLWWAIVTVATVGYGDVVPVTTAGKFIGVALILTSIGLIAIITANISGRFVLARSAAEASASDQDLRERLERIEAALARIEADRSA